MTDWHDTDNLTSDADDEDRRRPRLDGRQEAIRARLSQISSEAAEFYLGATSLIQSPPPAAAYLLAHAAREIESALRQYFVGDAPPDMPGTPACKEDGRSNHRQDIATALGLSDDDPVVVHWHGVAEQFHRLAHRRGRPRPLRRVIPVWEEFEDILHALLARFYDALPTIDELLSVPSPTSSHIQRLTVLLARPTSTRRRYFFSRLEHVGWLQPLDDAGFFSGPPLPVAIDEEGTLSHPPWPQSEYLVRMAQTDPETVRGVLLRILDRGHTDNALFRCDCVDAALSMPAHLAADIALRTRKWDGPLHFGLPDSLRQLACKLATEGEAATALKLAQSVLYIAPDCEGIKRARSDGATQAILPEPLSRMDMYDYEEFVCATFPLLTEAEGMETLRLSCVLLECALRFKLRGCRELESKSRKSNPDYSYVSRPAIEEKPTVNSLRDCLTNAVRDVACQVAERGVDSCQEVLDALAERPFPIFQRIALYVLSLHPRADIDRAARWLCDRSLLKDRHYHHEYSLLARAIYPLLSEARQDEVLESIQATVTEWQAELQSDAPSRTSHEIERATKRYRCNLLGLLGEVLPPEAMADYERLLAEVGEPLPPGEEFRIETRWGSPSPLAEEELAAMSPSHLAEFVRTWQPDPNEIWGAEPEGLGRAVQSVVAARPRPFAIEAMSFAAVDPTYVRHLLAGFSDAVRADMEFPWEHVFDLAAWVLQQPDTEEQSDSVYTLAVDPGWGWTRKEIAGLLENGIRRDHIAFELRDRVWELVCALTKDPDPTPEREERPEAMGPATMAINTVRGHAMHCVFHYALWCARHLRPDDTALSEQPPFSVEIPEVLTVLDLHLDQTADPSAAVRSVYGQFLRHLMLLAPDWLSRRIASIFPDDPAQHRLWRAAWNSFVGFNPPDEHLFPFLRKQYARAIETLNDPGGEEDRIGDDAHKRLAHHLVALYATSAMELDNKLLVAFFEQAPVALRSEIISFIGRSLLEASSAPSAEILERLQTLVEARIAAAEDATDEQAVSEELPEFGWCFHSSAFDDQWSLANLLKVLDLTGGIIRPSHLVMERLAVLVSEYPRDVVTIARRLVCGDSEDWRMFGWRAPLRTILDTAIRATSRNVRDGAIRLINELGERGNDEFRDLLDDVG